MTENSRSACVDLSLVLAVLELSGQPAPVLICAAAIFGWLRFPDVPRDWMRHASRRARDWWHGGTKWTRDRLRIPGFEPLFDVR